MKSPLNNLRSIFVLYKTIFYKHNINFFFFVPELPLRSAKCEIVKTPRAVKYVRLNHSLIVVVAQRNMRSLYARNFHITRVSRFTLFAIFKGQNKKRYIIL